MSIPTSAKLPTCSSSPYAAAVYCVHLSIGLDHRYCSSSTISSCNPMQPGQYTCVIFDHLSAHSPQCCWESLQCRYTTSDSQQGEYHTTGSRLVKLECARSLSAISHGVDRINGTVHFHWTRHRHALYSLDLSSQDLFSSGHEGWLLGLLLCQLPDLHEN